MDKTKKKIFDLCPVDHEKIELLVDLQVFQKFTSFPVSAGPVLHKDHSLIVYLDANLKIRGIERIQMPLTNQDQNKGLISISNSKIRYGHLKSADPKKYFGEKKVIFLD